MNERYFFYSDPEAAHGGEEQSEAASSAAENTVPVADAIATPDHSGDAAAADAHGDSNDSSEPMVTTAQTDVPASAPAVEEPVVPQAEPAAEPATEAALEQASTPASAESGETGETVVAAAEVQEEAPKGPPPVIITDELLAKLQAAKDAGASIEVQVAERVKGGLRVLFEGVRLFLPASQFYIKKTPSNDELESVVGTSIPVQVFEIQKDETGKISIIASRKNLLKTEFLRSINVGDTVEGVVSTIMPFGVFVDIGGYDGLIHISRISHQHVENPHNVFKRGDKVKAKIIEIDTAKDKIALSTKEFEESPWTTAEAEFPAGSRHKGIVKRLADFGAFVELKRGIEGLLRVGELSWTKRTGHPSEVLTVGQEIDVMVTDVSAEKKQVGLSLKRLSDSPWKGLSEKFPIGAETTGVVKQVTGQGAVLTVGGEYDGFMPRSKMRDIMRGNRIPYTTGDMVSVIIADMNEDNQSLILAPKVSEEEMARAAARGDGGRRDRREGEEREPRARVPKEAEAAANKNFSLADLLSETERSRLFGDSGQG
ncbi:MAG: S1 RNA-binding domain-containing protein [Candidatus Kapaibacterium sp.]